MRTDLFQSQAASLPYNLIRVSDGFTPLTGQTSAQLTCKYRKAGASSWATKTLNSGNTHEIGDGQYAIDWTAGDFDTLGAFYSELIGSDGSRYYREDMIALPALAGMTLHFQTAGLVPIANVTLQLRDASDTLQLATGQTDVAGNLVIGLPAGTYRVWPWKAGYTFAGAPFTLVVTGNATVNYTGAAFSPSNPGAPGTFVLQVHLVRSDGAPRAGITVNVQPVYRRRTLGRAIGVTSVSKVLTEAVQTATTDVDGYCQFSLIPSSDLRPTFEEYKLSILDTPARETWITMPAADAVLEDVL